MGRKRRPFVAVETDVAKDESFAVLADICGISRDEALGKIVRLWAWCADRKLQDAPEGCPGYAVPEAVITRWFGPDGIRGILGDGCEAFALGARWPGGLIYLRGTDETVAARRMQLAGARAGGESRIQGERDAHGRFVADNTNSPAGSPAGSRVDPRSQIPDPSPEISLPRAIPPSTEQAPVPAAPPATTRPASGGDPEPANQPTREDRKAVRDSIRAEINAARGRVGAKLGTPLHPVLPFDRGLDGDLAGQLALATTRADLDALAIQARHAVAMAELEAIAEPERVQFLTGAIFAGGNFARLAGKTAATARAGPKRSAARAEQKTIRPATTDDDEPPIPSWSKT